MSDTNQTYINWLQAHRPKSEASENFREWGLPHNKLEAWRYTSLVSQLNSVMAPDDLAILPDRAKLEALVPMNWPRLVLINGKWNAQLSNLSGQKDLPVIQISQQLPAEVAELHDGLEALNLACTEHALKLTLPKSQKFSTPLVIIHWGEGPAFLAGGTIQIEAEAFAEATILEIHWGPDSGPSEANRLTILDIGEGARIAHIKAQLENTESIHVGKLKARLQRDARLESFTLGLGGKLARNNLQVELKSPGAHADVHGLFAISGQQHSDQYSVIDHQSSHTTSEQLFKGILNDKSRGVFTGRVVIDRLSQQASAHQLNKNLLLSKGAQINTRPQLEVYADDVKCAHGATIGQLSEDELFYLEGRGIAPTRARQLLCHAFGAEALNKIGHPEVRQWLAARLPQNRAAWSLNE